VSFKLLSLSCLDIDYVAVRELGIVLAVSLLQVQHNLEQGYLVHRMDSAVTGLGLIVQLEYSEPKQTKQKRHTDTLQF
jgi:hypothetical protein